MPAQIFGAQAAVTTLNRAFTNSSPANAVYANQVANAGADVSAANAGNVLAYGTFANTFAAPYQSMAFADIATLLLTNMGITGDAQAQTFVVAFLTQMGKPNLGMSVLLLSAYLSSLEGDATYSTAAKAWNAELTSGFSYSSNASNTTPQIGDVAVPPTNQGQTFTLTTGVDTGAAFTGSSGNDTFNATTQYLPGTSTKANTLSSLDSLSGGAGTDTLVISDTDVGGYTIATGITLSGIENITISGAAGVTADITPSTITGVENLAVTQATTVSLTAGSTTAVSVAGATGAVTVAGGSTQTIASEQGANAITLTKGTNVTVNATKETTGAITIGTNAATTADHPTGTVNVTSTGLKYAASDSANSLGAITVNGGTTVTVNQTAYGDTVAAAADTSNVVRTQSAITVRGDNNTTAVTVIQSAAVTAKDAVVAAGKADSATVVFSTMVSGQTISIGGLTFTASKDLTAAETASIFANLTKADTMGSAGSSLGYYSGTLSNWTSGAANGSTVTFTGDAAATTLGEQATLAVTGTAVSAPVAPQVAPVVTNTTGVGYTAAVTGVAGVVGGAVVINENGATTHKIATVTLDGYGASSTITSDALTTLSLANSGQDVTVTNATANSTLALTLNKIGAAAYTAVGGASIAEVDAAVSIDGSAGKYTTLNVTTAGADSFVAETAASVTALSVAGTNAVKFTNDFSALKTVVVTGSAGLTLSGSENDTLTSVNTTGTTGTVTSSIGTATTYAGGAGVDVVTVGATTKALTLGAGNDTAVMSVAVGTNGSVDAGDGTDTLSMTAAQAVTLSADAAFQAGISNFEILKVGANAAAGVTINLNNMKNINQVSLDGDSATLLIDKFGANGSLTLTSAITAATEAKLTTSTGTDDVFNVVLTSKTALNNTGALTVAGVETVNITSTDTAFDTTLAQTLDTHTLTLVDTKAKTINVTGNAGLTLTNDATNTAVTLIDGSAMTGALTATTTNSTASETIKGGSGKDVLTSTDRKSVV